MLAEENFGFQHFIKLLVYKHYSEDWIIYGDGEEKYILYTGLFSLICKWFHQFFIRQDSEKKTIFLTNTVILKLILIFPVLNLSAYNECERGVNKTGANMSVYMYTVYGNGANWQPNKKHVLYIWQYIAKQQLMLSTEYLSFVLNVWRIVRKEPVDCYL